MNGKTHVEWGAVSSAIISAAAGNDPINVAACALVGYYVAKVPDQIERVPGSPFRFHRGMSHSWELMVAPMMLLAWWLPVGVDYLPWALALGVMSHLTGDFLFGKAGWGRKAGIPLLMGRHHIGLGIFKVGNLTEETLYVILRELKWGIIAGAIIWSLMRTAGVM